IVKSQPQALESEFAVNHAISPAAPKPEQAKRDLQKEPKFSLGPAPSKAANPQPATPPPPAPAAQFSRAVPIAQYGVASSASNSTDNAILPAAAAAKAPAPPLTPAPSYVQLGGNADGGPYRGTSAAFGVPRQTTVSTSSGLIDTKAQVVGSGT